MKDNRKILDEIGGKSGFKVPENYFENLSARITEQLPERELPKPEIVTPWQRVRPYLYMAAMFVGIWLMMQVFVVPSIEADKQMTADAEQQDLMDEYMLYSLDEYTVFEAFYADNE